MSDPLHTQGHQEALLPFISVIIPVRNEYEGLRLLLPDLLSQDYPAARWEIIVADGLSTDATPSLIDQFTLDSNVSIKLMTNPGIRSSAGRNLGILASKGDVVVFIDGHCRVRSSSLLSDTMELFQQNGAHCLCRPQPLGGSRDSTMSLNIAVVRSSPFGHGRGSMIYDLKFSGVVDPRSSGASYRRSVFDEVGLYDETFDACEDVELNVRVALSGMQGYSDPRLAIEYQARNTLRALAKQMMRYGRGRVRLARKHPSERSLSTWAPLMIWLAVLILPVGLKRAFPMMILTVPALLYLMAVFLATFQLVCRTRQIRLVSALAIYPVIHLGLGMGMILELLSLWGKASRPESRHPASIQPPASA